MLVTGDAGGLNYINNAMTDVPKSAFNFCCTCATPEPAKLETNLAPEKQVRKPPIKTEIVLPKIEPFSWNPRTIAKYTNMDSMMKQTQEQ